jgi:hypothetical protein
MYELQIPLRCKDIAFNTKPGDSHLYASGAIANDLNYCIPSTYILHNAIVIAKEAVLSNSAPAHAPPLISPLLFIRYQDFRI